MTAKVEATKSWELSGSEQTCIIMVWSNLKRSSCSVDPRFSFSCNPTQVIYIFAGPFEIDLPTYFFQQKTIRRKSNYSDLHCRLEDVHVACYPIRSDNLTGSVTEYTTANTVLLTLSCKRQCKWSSCRSLNWNISEIRFDAVLISIVYRWTEGQPNRWTIAPCLALTYLLWCT